MLLTLGTIRPYISTALNIPSNDPRIAVYVNQAIERLLFCGKYKGTYQRYNFVTNEGCVTLPYFLETMLAAAVCHLPKVIRNEWFEFLGSGPGVQTCGWNRGASMNIMDRGDKFVTTWDIPTPSYLKIYCDLPEASGLYMTLCGLDPNNNPIRTQDSTGTWMDGENVPINSVSPAQSINVFGAGPLAQVIKPPTNGILRLYAVDAVTGVQSLLGIYDPNTTQPCYHRYFIPDAQQQCCTGSSNGTPTNFTVETICKLRFIPVVNDGDILLIQNVGALKEMATAIMMAEPSRGSAQSIQMADAHETRAKGLLEGQLSELIGNSALNFTLHGFGRGVAKSMW